MEASEPRRFTELPPPVDAGGSAVVLRAVSREKAGGEHNDGTRIRNRVTNLLQVDLASDLTERTVDAPGAYHLVGSCEASHELADTQRAEGRSSPANREFN